MRKITIESVTAFENSYEFNKQNMSVCVDGRETLLKLHGNTIAKKSGGKLFITNCGWETTTTKERLNALNGVSISQKNFIWYLNGKEWNGDWIEIN